MDGLSFATLKNHLLLHRYGVADGRNCHGQLHVSQLSRSCPGILLA